MSDAKPMTTAEVEAMPKHTDNPHTYVAEYPNHVLVRRDELIATTRALETAQAALRDEKARIDGVAATFDELGSGYLARAEKAEKERDLAKSFFAELVRERDTARFDRDAARGDYENMRQQSVDLALLADKSVGERDAARAEGVELLEQRDRARRALAAEIETTRATKARVAELVAALEGCAEWMDCNPPADGWGLLDKRADADRHEAIDAARGVLRKAKEAGL